MATTPTTSPTGAPPRPGTPPRPNHPSPTCSPSSAAPSSPPNFRLNAQLSPASSKSPPCTGPGPQQPHSAKVEELIALAGKGRLYKMQCRERPLPGRSLIGPVTNNGLD